MEKEDQSHTHSTVEEDFVSSSSEEEEEGFDSKTMMPQEGRAGGGDEDIESVADESSSIEDSVTQSECTMGLEEQPAMPVEQKQPAASTQRTKAKKKKSSKSKRASRKKSYSNSIALVQRPTWDAERNAHVCPGKGHPLQSETVHHRLEQAQAKHVTCDGCNHRLRGSNKDQANLMIYSCCECNVDFCTNCLQTVKQQDETEPTAVPTALDPSCISEDTIEGESVIRSASKEEEEEKKETEDEQDRQSQGTTATTTTTTIEELQEQVMEQVQHFQFTSAAWADGVLSSSSSEHDDADSLSTLDAVPASVVQTVLEARQDSLAAQHQLLVKTKELAASREELMIMHQTINDLTELVQIQQEKLVQDQQRARQLQEDLDGVVAEDDAKLVDWMHQEWQRLQKVLQELHAKEERLQSQTAHLQLQVSMVDQTDALHQENARLQTQRVAHQAATAARLAKQECIRQDLEEQCAAMRCTLDEDLSLALAQVQQDLSKATLDLKKVEADQQRIDHAKANLVETTTNVDALQAEALLLGAKVDSLQRTHETSSAKLEDWQTKAQIWQDRAVAAERAAGGGKETVPPPTSSTRLLRHFFGGGKSEEVTPPPLESKNNNNSAAIGQDAGAPPKSPLEIRLSVLQDRHDAQNVQLAELRQEMALLHQEWEKQAAAKDRRIEELTLRLQDYHKSTLSQASWNVLVE